MKADVRGRVRFAFKGTRFELSKNGIHSYERYTSWQGKDKEYTEGSIDQAHTLRTNFADPEFRTKLHEALGELRIYEDDPCRFTKDIFIPKHMRAV